MKNFLNTLKKNYIYGIILVLLIASIILGVSLYKENKTHAITVQNRYNYAFYELVDYVQNMENYLAKATITSTPEHSAETLTNLWREANLAQVYLAQLPISSNELASTAKFLNQVSEYSYALSRKNIYNEELTQEDLDNLTKMHTYCIELKNILNQLYTDMSEGRISWKELTKDANVEFAQQVDNISATSFSNIDENFGEYAGLIYDGAFSEHIEKADKKGLVGEDINEEKAKDIIKEFVGKERIEKIISNGFIDNGDIPVYDFSIKLKNADNNNSMTISIAKKGGHIVNMNYNKTINIETISIEEANKIGKDFLNSRNIPNMKETYYLREGGAITVNYAYEQENVVIYPDLIKVKIALDNGEILGVETSGYLNSHEKRTIKEPKITIEEAKENLNKNLEITSSGLAIIPTEWKTEILCYEFKGKIKETDFLVYINAETGIEENILVIIDTPNGILTQ